MNSPEPAPSPRRVLIAGCGYVGTELGLQLGARATEIWGLRRDPSGLPAPIRPIAADLLDANLDTSLPLVDAVVYAASADSSDPGPYRAAYVDGVGNVMAALARRGAPVRRFIFVSSTAVYGDAAGGWVDEETPTVPDNFRGDLVLEGERAALNGPFPATILRLGGIYGPGRRRLIDQVRSGRATCPDPASGVEDSWSNRIHRDDAAGILAHLLGLGHAPLRNAPLPGTTPGTSHGTSHGDAPRRDTPLGDTLLGDTLLGDTLLGDTPRSDSHDHSVYLGVDHEPARLCAVYTHVARLLGVPAPGTSPTAARQRSNKRCSSLRIREAGYRFRFPTFREGYGAMLSEDGVSE